MPSQLVLGPSASGKTLRCIARVREVLAEDPLASVWVVLPDRNQALAFGRRLAREGGALGARIGTFEDVYKEILALSHRSLPPASEPLVHRLIRAAIEQNLGDGQLEHYRPISARPGFTEAVAALVEELKRALVLPERFQEATAGRGPRLSELAALYARYQSLLIELDWADSQGEGWLAVDALEKDSALASHWRLLVADGFDSFNSVTLKALGLLSGRVPEMLVTLTWDGHTAERRVYDRFERTLKQLEDAIHPETETLDRPRIRPGPLSHLEEFVFETRAQKVQAGRHIAWLEAQTLRLEAREALRWLKARIVRDGVEPDDCAVIARDLGAYRPFLQEAAAEFGLPLRFLGGEPLMRNPLVDAVFNLLELPGVNWKRRPLLDAIRTPYFDLSRLGLDHAAAQPLDDVARYGQVVEGREQWISVLDDLAEQKAEEDAENDEDERSLPELRGEPAAALRRGLDALIDKCTPRKLALLQEHVGWVLDLLFGRDGLAVIESAQKENRESARDLLAAKSLGETLQALALSERVAGERAAMTFDKFLEEWQGVVQATTYNPDPPHIRLESRIYAGNLNTTRGIPYRAVVLLGLSEGLFPAPLHEDPFLSDQDRRALAQFEIRLEPRLRNDQHSQFYEAVTRAGEFLLLTRPYLGPDGEEWKPSPYWEASRSLFADLPRPRRVRADNRIPLSDAASRLEVLAGASRAGNLPEAYDELHSEWERIQGAGEVLRARLTREPAGPFEGDCSELAPQLAARYDAGHTWSTSRLEKYGICGFNFWLGAALGLDLREPPAPGFDAAQLGSMLHAILEEAYRSATNRRDPENVIARLHEVAGPILDAAPKKYGFRESPLWLQERAELVERLEETVRALAKEDGEYVPVAFEARFGFDGERPLVIRGSHGAIRLHGVIDRVDRSPEGKLRIIDYKTGSSGFSSKEFEQGRRLQLALYGLAAEKTLRLGALADGFYWGILAAKKSTLKLSAVNAEHGGIKYHGASGAKKLVEKWVEEHVEGIHSGRFAPVPTGDDCPSYCPGKLFCWRYSPSERP